MRFLKDQTGYALMMTVIIMMVLLVLGAAVVQYALFNMNQTVKAEQDLKAYYLARSGADAASEYLIQNPGKGSSFMGSKSEPTSFEGGTFTVEITESGGMVEVLSTGNFQGRTRAVKRILRKVGGPLKQTVFAATGEGSSEEPAIKLEGSARIIGTTGTNATGEASVQLAWSTGIDDGDLLVGAHGDMEQVIDSEQPPKNHVPNGKIGQLDDVVTFEVPPFPEFPGNLPSRDDLSTDKQNHTYIIAEDGQYDLINVHANRNLTFDLKGGVRKIRVKEMTISGSVEIINRGTDGKLILYVEKLFQAVDNSRVNATGQGKDTPGALTVYLDGTNAFGGVAPDTFHQYQFVGNVVARNAPVMLGKGSMVRGGVVTGGDMVKVSGGATAVNAVIYAPNAHVDVKGSGATGAIVAHSLSASGNARIIYDENAAHDESVLELIHSGEGGFIAYRGGTWHPVMIQ